LAGAGFREVVINQGHSATSEPGAGDGSRWGIHHWSDGSPRRWKRAAFLAAVGDRPFLVVDGDV
jgi:hypothetical protein